MNSLYLLIRITLTFLIFTPNLRADAEACRRLFADSTPFFDEVNNLAAYNKDYGDGVFLWKINKSEFRIEPPPPPLILHTAREAQKKLHQLAKDHMGDKFTVVFQGLSEQEVLDYKAMLHRDQKFSQDDRLRSVLLETDPLTDQSADKNKGYELFRESALRARDQMLLRYDWSTATVSLESNNTPLIQIYKLSVQREKKPENFLLRLRLKSAKFLKNRTSTILSILALPSLKNANVEQMANQVIADIKKSDKGISDGTLKVMTGDFIIAIATGIVEG